MFQQLSKFFLYASIFCIVVVMASTFFPFIGGKYYFFRFAVEASLACMLLWWGFDAPKGELKARFMKLWQSPIFKAVSAFVLMFTLASLFADDPKLAFWSNYERGEGGFQMLHYYAFFILLGLLFRDREDWRKLFKLSIVAACIMIVYGVGAAMLTPQTDPATGNVIGYTAPLNMIGPYRGTDGTPLASSTLARVFTSNARFQGSLGNPAYVAPYLLFVMFYALYLWIEKGRGQNKWMHVGFGALNLFFLVFFVLSQTRGGFLGLAAALIAYFIYIAFTNERFRKPAAIGLGAVAVIGALLFAFRGPLVENNIPGSRFLTISLTEQTAQTRFWTWGAAWKGFKDRPIFGWGPENFSTVFDKHFDTRHFIPGQNTETWFDRAHSVIFDYLAETGFMGFLSYIAMFGAFIYSFFYFRKSATDMSPWLQALLPTIILAYLVQALILFDVLPIYINLFIVLAFAMFEFQRSHEHNT